MIQYFVSSCAVKVNLFGCSGKSLKLDFNIQWYFGQAWIGSGGEICNIETYSWKMQTHFHLLRSSSGLYRKTILLKMPPKDILTFSN